MSRAWRHTLCLSCWSQLYPRRHPYLLDGPAATELCCSCGAVTDTPVYYRAEPTAFPCKGWHDAAMHGRVRPHSPGEPR